MKQNMCVTIDEEIHSWLKNKNEMMSRLVNQILWKAMQKEMQQRAIKNGEQEQLDLEYVERYCVTCHTTQKHGMLGCKNRSCKEYGSALEIISDQTSSQ